MTEEEFFHKGESGGTFISSGYTKALEIIEQRYHPALWNVYVFHCSDGDNFESDNDAALKAAQQIAQEANLFGYGEIKPLGSRLLRQQHDQLFLPNQRVQFPDRANSKERRHLELVQELPR